MGEEKKKRDSLSYIESVIKANNMLVLINRALIAVSILSLIVTITVLFTKKTQLVVLDPTGRPYLTTTVHDKLTRPEVQRFVQDALTNILEVSYTEFLTKESVAVRQARIGRFFKKEIYERFWEDYLKSDFIRSIIANKIITRIVFTGAFDVRRDPEKKETITAVGKVTVTSLSTTSEASSDKIYEIHIQQGPRTQYNPYGLYITTVTERIGENK